MGLLVKTTYPTFPYRATTLNQLLLERQPKDLFYFFFVSYVYQYRDRILSYIGISGLRKI